MTIKFDALTALLTKYVKLIDDDLAPDHALYIDFQDKPKKSSDSAVYQLNNGSIIVLDLDEDGVVFGIEIT